MADATLVIKILADAKQAAAGLDDAAGKSSKFQAGLSKMAVPAAAVAAGVALIGAKAIKSASDLQQAQGAVESVFGKSASAVEKFSQTADTRMGLAASAYQNYAALVGSALQNAGFSQAQSVAESDKIMQRAADMAATFGGTTAEAVEAINAAVARGEYDPLEKYGVALNATAVNAELAKRGQKDLTGEALANAKATIALEQIYGKTAKSAGQFARESDSAAGAQQIASAQFENASAALGTSLLPAVTKVMQALTKLAATMAKHKTITLIVIGVIGAMAVAILALNVAVGIYTAVTTLAASTTVAAWVAALWPILAVIAAVALVVGAVVLLWKKSETFRKVVLAVWGAIKRAAQATGAFIKRAWTAVWNALKTAARAMGSAIKAVWSGIKGAVGRVVGGIKSAWLSTMRAIRSAMSSAKGAIVAVWRGMKSAVGTIIGGIRSAWSGTISAVKGAVRGLGAILSGPFNTVKSAINAVKSAIDAVISAVGNLISKIANIHFPKIPDLNPFKSSRSAPPVPAMGRTGGYLAPAVPAGRAAGGGGLVVNVYGAIDPEGTARTIRRVLAQHDRRMGVRVT